MPYDSQYLSMKKMKKNYPLQEEELNSRIEIQKRSLETYEKEIYENIGQVLSLVRLQLLNLDIEENKVSEKIQDSGTLVGKAISDLRSLTKQPTPDEIIEKGFTKTFITELKRLADAGLCQIEFFEKGSFFNLGEIKELVAFCALQQIIYPILNIYKPAVIGLVFRYKKNKIEINIEQKSETELLFLMDELMLLKKRLNAINGDIYYKSNNWRVFQIIINK